MTGYPPSRADDGVNCDSSLEALLTNTEKKKENVTGLGSLSVKFHGMSALLVHAALLFVASTFFSLWIISIRATCPLDLLLTYSPVNEAVQYVEKRFDGNLDSISIFRGYPSPAIDAAWMKVSIDVKATRLTHEQYVMVGGNDSNTAAVKYQPQDGGGYMSQIDGYHHVHCLDLLRKYLRKDYYAPFDPSFNAVLQAHLGHCVEIIRQKLMCTVDLTMVTYNYEWVPGQDQPHLHPNLSATHQCVDYERLLEWSAEHNAHVLKSHVVKFGDATELAESPVLSKLPTTLE